MSKPMSAAEKKRRLKEAKIQDIDFMGQLQGFVDYCLSTLEEDFGDGIREISQRVKLSRTTVLRLKRHSFTPGTHARTLMKLAEASKCQMAWGGAQPGKAAKSMAPTATVRRRRALTTR